MIQLGKNSESEEIPLIMWSARRSCCRI